MRKIIIYSLTLIATAVSFLSINTGLFESGPDARIQSTAKQSSVFKNNDIKIESKDGIVTLNGTVPDMFKTHIKGDDIIIQAKDGIVTITGTVFEESCKFVVQKTIAGLPGVRSVENKLEVKDETRPMETDTWLTLNAEPARLFYPGVNNSKSKVFGKEEPLTLRAKAIGAVQKDPLIEYAQGLDGVKNVKNEMAVFNVAMKPSEKTIGEKMDAISEWIDDASVTALVKTALLYHRLAGGLTTTVETTEGVVMLGGRAENTAEKEMATKLVRDVHGVKKVVNNMTVEAIEPKTD